MMDKVRRDGGKMGDGEDGVVNGDRIGGELGMGGRGRGEREGG